MKSSYLYGVVLSSVFCVFLLRCLLKNLYRPVSLFLRVILNRHLVVPLLIERPRGTTNISRFEFLVLFSYLSGITSILVKNGSSNLNKGSTELFSINLVPLYLAGRTGLLAEKLLGLRRDQCDFIHRWVGRVGACLGLIHGILALRMKRQKITVIGITLSALLFCFFFLTAACIRRRFYEWFLKIHFLTSTALLILVATHVDLGKNLHTFCLLLATLLAIVQLIGTWAIFLYRNWAFSSQRSSSIETLAGRTQRAALITFRPARPWRKIRPGQYVYITVSNHTKHFFGALQAHPYYVLWDEGDKGPFTILVASQQGFSQDICMRSTISPVWVTGPYGQWQSLHEYDNLCFISCGIGITAYILCIKYLVQARRERKTPLRRISLAWVLENSNQKAWVIRYLKLLAKMPSAKILAITIYDPNVRTTKIYEEIQPNLWETGHNFSFDCIKMERKKEAGKMAVSICGSPIFEKEGRQAFAESRINAVYLQAEFQPEPNIDLDAEASKAQSLSKVILEPV